MRTLALVLLSLTVAAPASAQFKVPKKVKEMTGAEKAKPAAVPAGAAGGGTLVLDDAVIGRLIKGMRAANAYREDAKQANTPYGRHMQAKAAYTEAKAKCDAAMQSYTSRMSGNPKLAEKNADKTGVYTDKMIAAQQKGDTAAQRMWADSMALIFDPACVVKEPQQPSDFYDQQQVVEQGAAQAELAASELDGRESGQAKDRAIAIIQDAPPPDVSPSEQQAVSKREKELKDLMGLTPPPETRAEKPAPPPPPAPAAAPVDTALQAASECRGRNAQKNEKEVERLGKLAAAAADAGDVARAMVYADSINQIQSAGCSQ
ncbi:MAG TPA: hypothetical protein VIQ27_11685 [Gemmatimonadales bacterium]